MKRRSCCLHFYACILANTLTGSRRQSKSGRFAAGHNIAHQKAVSTIIERLWHVIFLEDPILDRHDTRAHCAEWLIPSRGDMGFRPFLQRLALEHSIPLTESQDVEMSALSCPEGATMCEAWGHLSERQKVKNMAHAADEYADFEKAFINTVVPGWGNLRLRCIPSSAHAWITSIWHGGSPTFEIEGLHSASAACAPLCASRFSRVVETLGLAVLVLLFEPTRACTLGTTLPISLGPVPAVCLSL